jgi:hypothetical protein
MNEKGPAINGQGLDILEEFGIHVTEKVSKAPLRSEPVQTIRDSILEIKKDLVGVIPREQVNAIFDPIDDLLDLAEKFGGKRGTAQKISMLLLVISSGFLKNPTFIDLLLLDAIKRATSIKDKDPYKLLMEGMDALEEAEEILRKAN